MRTSLLFVAALLAVPALSCKTKPQEEVIAEDAKRPLSSLTAPTGVVLFGGGGSVDKLKDHLGTLCAAVQLPKCPDFKVQELGLASGAGLDLKKPFRFAVVDPKKSREEAVVLAFTMTSRDALVASLPPEKVEDEATHQYKLSGDRFVNIVGNTAVFTRGEKVFAERRDWLRDLAVSTSGVDLVALVPMANVNAAYGATVQQAFAQAKMQQTGMLGGMGAVLDTMQSSLEQIDRLALSATVLEDGTALRLEVTPKPGSALEKTFAGLKGGDNGLLARYPDTSAFLGVKADPATLGVFGDAFLSQLSKQPELLAKMKEGYAISTGEMVLGRVAQGEKSTILALIGTTDEARSRALQKEMLPLLETPEMKAMHEQLHMKQTVELNAYSIQGVEVGVAKTDFLADKPKPGARAGTGLTPPAPPAAVQAMFGEQHFAVAKGVSVMAYGATAKDAMTTFLEGKLDGGLDKSAAVARLKKNGVPSPLVVGSVKPSDLLQGMIPGMAPSDAKEPGLSVSAGTQGTSFVLVLDLPTKPLALAGQALMMLQASMGRRGGPRPL